MRRIVTATALVAALATVTMAHAFAQGPSGPQWATVNSCSPTAVGVRASLPGDGSSARMRVRFTAQYYSTTKRAWLPVQGVPSSPWVDAGSARYSYGQAGWTFQLDPGSHAQVRALADMEWLEGGSVVKAARMMTTGGVGSDVGGSQAVCQL